MSHDLRGFKIKSSGRFPPISQKPGIGNSHGSDEWPENSMAMNGPNCISNQKN